MSSTKTQFISELKAAILAITEIKDFRGYNGQFDDPESFRENPIVTPAVLWQLTDIPWISGGNVRGGSVQYATDAEIVLHVMVGSFGVDPNIDDAVFEIADKVSRAAASVAGDEFGGVVRINESMDVSHGTVIDHQITFRFKIGDCSTFVKGDGGSSVILRTLQQYGDIQQAPPNAEINFGKTPTHGTDNPGD